MSTDVPFAAIVGYARRNAACLDGGPTTAAEFDYQLTLGPRNGGWAAFTALGNALYCLANEGHEDDDLTAKTARGRSLGERYAGELEQLIADAKAKSYTGWSTASRGPIRYAR